MGLDNLRLLVTIFLAYLRSLHRLHSRQLSANNSFRVGVDCASQTDLYHYKRRDYPAYLDVGVIQNNLNAGRLSDTWIRGANKTHAYDDKFWDHV